MIGRRSKTGGWRARRVRPYRVISSGRTSEEVVDQINRAVYAAHGPDVGARAGVVGIMAEPVGQYEALLRRISASPRVAFVTMEQAVLQPRSDVVQCVVRHDIDVDIRTALVMARQEQELGLNTSFYVLHTAPYYGDQKDGVFRRNESMGPLYLELQNRGHEVGMHSDGLLLYQGHGVDGAQGLAEELEWLRSIGLRIRGTVAHNSVSTYGAANYALFKGRPQSYAADPNDCPAEIVHEGKWSPLGVLDERALGLTYEGNDIFWQSERQVMYGVVSGADYWWWEEEKSVERIRAAARAGRKLQPAHIGADEVVERIQSAEPGTIVCLVVHPVYYGARHGARVGPARRLAHTSVVPSAELGWFTYEPGSIQAAYGETHGGVEWQVINVVNECGMLDLPLQLANEPERCQRIIFVGGDNIDASTCMEEGHLQRRVERHFGDRFGALRCHKLAHPGMGVGRYAGWLRWIAGRFPGARVVLGVGADETRRADPSGWVRTTGVHRRYPAGECLFLDDGKVKVQSPSPAWAIHRRGVGDDKSIRLGERSGVDEIALEPAIECCVELATGHELSVLLLVDECGEHCGYWTSGAAGIDSARRLHAELLGRLEPLAERLAVPLIDPYREMLALAEEGKRCHWTSVPQWNYRGHLVAAQAVAATVALGLEAGAGAAEKSDG